MNSTFHLISHGKGCFNGKIVDLQNAKDRSKQKCGDTSFTFTLSAMSFLWNKQTNEHMIPSSKQIG